MGIFCLLFVINLLYNAIIWLAMLKLRQSYFTLSKLLKINNRFLAIKLIADGISPILSLIIFISNQLISLLSYFKMYYFIIYLLFQIKIYKNLL